MTGIRDNPAEDKPHPHSARRRPEEMCRSRTLQAQLSLSLCAIIHMYGYMDVNGAN